MRTRIELKSMVTLQIDNQIVNAKPDSTVLAAAREHGLHIPTLCFHPALKPSGSCRLCSVEVMRASGKPIVMLSCVLQVKEGMQVSTTGPGVVRARTKALKNLLAMAPLAERLHDLAQKEGIDLPPPPDGCIRCRLCVRVCKEIVGQEALRMESVNSRLTVVPNPGRCIGCGTCVNLCPTHVLRISDEANVRTIRIHETLIGQHPLQRCEGCGKYYATVKHVQRIKERTTDHPQLKLAHKYCPTCAKLFSDRLLILRKQPPKQGSKSK